MKPPVNQIRGGDPLWIDDGPAGVILRNEVFDASRAIVSWVEFEYTVGGSADVTAIPGVGAVTVAGLAPTVAASVVAAAGLGSVTVAGFAPTVAAGAVAATGTGAVTLAGLAPTVAAGASTTPSTGAVTIAGLAPTVSANVNAAPGVGAVTVTGFAPTVEVGGNVNVTPGVGSVVVLGLAPTVDVGFVTKGGRHRKDKRQFAIGVKLVELWEDDPLVETLERVEKALRLYKPIATPDIRKLARLPGVKKALEKAIRERDDEEAALIMLVA